MEFYLPQLCHLVISGKGIDFDDDGTTVAKRLERFIIELSLTRPDLAFKTLLMYQSYFKDNLALQTHVSMEEAKQTKMERHANEVVEMLESSIINGAIPMRFLYNQEDTGAEAHVSPDAQIDKIHKADYLTL